jgi:hypothetical protein
LKLIKFKRNNITMTGFDNNVVIQLIKYMPAYISVETLA